MTPNKNVPAETIPRSASESAREEKAPCDAAPRLRQKSEPRRGRRAPEDFVPMWETPEATNPLKVLLRPGQLFRRPGGRELLEQPDRFVLIAQRLGMFQRQVDEHAFDRRELQVPASVDRLHSEHARLRVTGKRLRRITINVACELIEQKNQRQHA